MGIMKRLAQQKGAKLKAAELPAHCNICKGEFFGGVAVDGKTTRGPWAFMCADCYGRFGVGLGIGKGQAFILQPSGVWEREPFDV